jgi:hypothetical protein
VARKTPSNSPWYHLYVVDETFRDQNHANGKLFRRRFRVTWAIYNAVVTEARLEGWFAEHERKNSAGKVGCGLVSELSLLVILNVNIIKSHFIFHAI